MQLNKDCKKEDSGDNSERNLFKWLSAPLIEENTNTNIYHKFEWNKMEITCFDTVIVAKENGVDIGRIIKIYQTGNDIPYILLKWYLRPNTNEKRLIFDNTFQQNLALKNIISKVKIFDSQQNNDEFWCDHGCKLNNNGQRELFILTNNEYNDEYWNNKKQIESQKFNQLSTSQQILIQQTNINNDSNDSNDFNDNDSSSSNSSGHDHNNSHIMTRNSNRMRSFNRNSRKRKIDEINNNDDNNDLSHNNLQQSPPRKRRRTSLSLSISSPSSSSTSSSSSPCKRCKKSLKTEVKILTNSLNQKDSIIGHFDNLIHQKDGIIQQKDGIIKQKDDLIDTYKSIVTTTSH